MPEKERKTDMNQAENGKPDASDPAKGTSDDFSTFKEFYTITGKVLATLLGMGSIFMLFGYIIIQSFISGQKLYGITSFSQEFYKDAAVTFMYDMFSFYGGNIIPLLLVLFIISAILRIVINRGCDNSRKKSDEQPIQSSSEEGSKGNKTPIHNRVPVISWLTITFLIIVTLLIICPEQVNNVFEKYGLEYGPEKTQAVLFLLAVPALIMSIIYLSVRFGTFVKKPYWFYCELTLFAITLLMAVPVSYGKFIYDIQLFPLTGIDYSESPKVNSLNTLKTAIDSQDISDCASNGFRFFLMANTSNGITIFDKRDQFNPSSVIVVDKSLIKYQTIFNDSMTTVRKVLSSKNPGVIGDKPITGLATKVGPLPDNFKKYANK